MILNLNVELSIVFLVQRGNHKSVPLKFLCIISTHLSDSYYTFRSFSIHTWHSICWNHKGNVLIPEEQILLPTLHLFKRSYRKQKVLYGLSSRGFILTCSGTQERAGNLIAYLGSAFYHLHFSHTQGEVQDLAFSNGRRAFTMITP